MFWPRKVKDKEFVLSKIKEIARLWPNGYLSAGRRRGDASRLILSPCSAMDSALASEASGTGSTPVRGAINIK